MKLQILLASLGITRIIDTHLLNLCLLCEKYMSQIHNTNTWFLLVQIDGASSVEINVLWYLYLNPNME